MTTIAYHHASKTIAYDSRRKNEKRIVDDAVMKQRVNHQGNFFLCGTTWDMDIFMNEFEDGKEFRDLNVAALFVPHGSDEVYELTHEKGRFRKDGPIYHNYAIGSGTNFAIAAMDFERNAGEAVEYAKTRDFCSGGVVHTWSIDSNSKQGSDLLHSENATSSAPEQLRRAG